MLFHYFYGLQTHDIKQQRIAWAKEAGTFAETGDYFYFVGCLPYFEVTFAYLNLSPLSSAKSVLSLLNKMGVTPVISNDECCCGHDALWSGDEATFRALAAKNLEAIKNSGAKTVLFSCPEGYYTFKHHYPEYFLGWCSTNPQNLHHNHHQQLVYTYLV